MRRAGVEPAQTMRVFYRHLGSPMPRPTHVHSETGGNRTYGLHVQSVARLPTASALENAEHGQRQGVWGDSNPPPRLSQSRMLAFTLQTPSVTNSTPTRSRTQNVSFKARNDVHFTIGANRSTNFRSLRKTSEVSGGLAAEGKGVEPLSPRGARLSRAFWRAVSSYLPNPPKAVESQFL